MDTLVTTDWLSGHLDDPDLVILDCTVLLEPDGSSFRIISGRDAYNAGHLPGAAFADLCTDLCDPASPMHFAIPTAEEFCETMGQLGVGDDSRVVLYDGNKSMWAARVWWMLRWAGFDRAAILDGGVTAWAAEDQPFSTEPAMPQPRTLTPSPRPELIAHQDEVRDAVADGNTSLVDALPERMFHQRHIPGAINVDAVGLLDELDRYLATEKLASLHDFDPDARTITYCGGGIAASSNAFVLARLGFTDIAVYAASMQEWSADPANPLEGDTA